MAKYRMCSGLAIAPNRDLNMLQQMSRKGWHLAAMAGLGFCYRLEEGEAHSYQYALSMEPAVNAEMLSLYKASGWTPVVACNGYQIFRAEPGTAPIFSDTDSEIEVLRKNRKTAGVGSLLFGAVLALLLGLIIFVQWNVPFAILLFIAWGLFGFFFFPFVGFSVSLQRKKPK